MGRCCELALGREECCGGLNDLVSERPPHPPILINEMHREGKQPAITQEVLLSGEGNGVIITYPHFFFLFLSFSNFSTSLSPLSSIVSLSFFAVMINKHTHLCQFIYTGRRGILCLSKTFSSDFWQSLSKLGEGFFFFFFCGSMLFVSVTTDVVIPFHSVVWLCPIMPARSVSACTPLGRQEGDCWARQSPFSH